MGIMNYKMPWSNMHGFNLDWIIKTITDLEAQVEEAIDSIPELITSGLIGDSETLYFTIPNGLSGDGVSDNSIALETLLNEIDGEDANIVFTKGSYYFGSDVTVPDNITLVMLNGSDIKIGGGVTFTGEGAELVGGLHKIIDNGLGGTIEGDWNIEKVFPQWFGAVGDGSTDDTYAVQNAIDFVGVIGGGVLYFNEGIYLLDGVEISNRDTHIVGAGVGATMLMLSDADGKLLYFNEVVTCSVKELTLTTQTDLECTSGGHLWLDKVAKCSFSNIEISNFYQGVVLRGGWVNNFSEIMASVDSWKSTACENFFLLTVHPTESGDWSPVNTKLHRCDGAGANVDWCNTGYKVESGDWVHLSDCHFNKAVDGFKISTVTDTRFISDIELNGCYIDESSNCQFVFEGSAVNSVGGIRLIGCFLRNAGVNNVLVTYAGTVEQLTLSGCVFEKAGSTALQLNPSTGRNLVVSGCQIQEFNLNSLATMFGIYNVFDQSVISNNLFYVVGGQPIQDVIRCTSIANNLAIIGNVFNLADINIIGKTLNIQGGTYISVRANAGVGDWDKPDTSLVSGGTLPLPKTKFVYIDTEGGAVSDDMDYIVAGEQGQFATLMCVDSAREVTVKHATGNIRLDGQSDFLMNHSADTITLVYGNGFWCEVSRSDNNV